MDCAAFLQWALPQRGLRWPGFRKVRRQVCKRLTARMRELGLANLKAYQARLIADPSEWAAFDACCHVTISRFFRDKGVFEALRTKVLPGVADRARRERRGVRVWSAGCASGEEPYTLKILWDVDIAPSYPDVALSIVATDVDEAVLARAHRACYEPSSLHELPIAVVNTAFDRMGALFCVKPRHRDGIAFLHQDVRNAAPGGSFDLILCRYLAFTYFAPPLQSAVHERLVDALAPGGVLVIGTHEMLPDASTLKPVAGAQQIFEKP